MANDVALTLLDPLINGNREIANVSQLFGSTWRHTIRRRGGFFIGTAELTEKDLTVAEMEEFFQYGLLREIRERGGGAETWRGLLAQMDYTRRGDRFVQSVASMSNALRTVYSRIGDNVLTNGSGETGMWAAYNGPTAVTITQDVTWASDGTYSIKIVVTDTTVRGAIVQAGITIEAKVLYVIRATLNITSGRWVVGVFRSDTGEELAGFYTGDTTGDLACEFYISDDNTYAGNVVMRVQTEGVAGVINVDACVFQRGPERAETKWYTDPPSIAMFGRKERILLEGGLSNAAANNLTASELLDTAWPNPQPPRTGQTFDLDQKAEAKLSLTFAGYWAMMNWVYSSIFGTLSNSSWVSRLIALQPAIRAGIIMSNTAEFQVEDNDLLRAGDILKAIASTGETNGAKWGVGVYADRKLNYERIDETLKYIYTGGKLLDTQSAPVEPWLAQPGWALWQDMPISSSLTSHQRHDPRWVYLEEVEMRADGTIGFSLDESGGIDDGA